VESNDARSFETSSYARFRISEKYATDSRAESPSTILWALAVVRDRCLAQQRRTTPMLDAMAASNLRGTRGAVRYLEKIVTRAEGAAIAAAARRGGRRVVFTNGCFDLLHVGHVRYLAAARDAGDLLVVGLNADASVRRLKGPSRPLVAEGARAEVVAALAAVDYVVVFEEDTPYDLIRALEPDVLVKGSDWAPDQVVGRDVVEERGGRVLLVPVVAGFSTTALVERLRHG
jgi:rfaE bifunctional protein nucleotidyltransferase chain/domain